MIMSSWFKAPTRSYSLQVLLSPDDEIAWLIIYFSLLLSWSDPQFGLNVALKQLIRLWDGKKNIYKNTSSMTSGKEGYATAPSVCVSCEYAWIFFSAFRTATLLTLPPGGSKYHDRPQVVGYRLSKCNFLLKLIMEIQIF